MSRYVLIRRLYGPAFLLLVGVDALLDQANILSWGQSWPFYLILLGVLKLAERAALASEGYPQQGYVGGMPNAGQPYPAAAGWNPYSNPGSNPGWNAGPAATPAPAEPGTNVVPSIPIEIIRKPEEKGPEGGQQ